MLLVGNHTGGNMSPEVIVLPLAFSTYFGVERPFYQLAHNLVLASPVGQILRRYGTVTASPENAQRALETGGAQPKDVAKTTVYVAGASYEAQSAVWQVVRNSEIGRAPSTLVGVPTLGYRGQLVEVEAIALID